MSQITAVSAAPRVSFSEIELCARLGRCPRSLLNWRTGGSKPKIPFFRQGQQVRYLLTDIEAFEKSHA